LISVIVPALNEEAQIEETLRSLTSQTQKRNEYEIVVVDGGSTDGTCNIAKRYTDKVIVQTHPGIGGARKDGAEAASGRILAFTDADTTFPPNWLDTISENLKVYEASTGPVIFQNGNIKTAILSTWRTLYRPLNLLNFYYIIGSNMAVRTKTYWRAGGHSDVSLLDDYDLSVKLFRKGTWSCYDSRQEVYTSSRRAHKLLTYGITVAYGHYNYMIAKDYDKLLNYPKVENMMIKDVLTGSKWGKNALTMMTSVQTTLQETMKR